MTKDSHYRYIGTSARGITKEIELPVPWGVIAGKTYGNPEGSPVLCLHGWLDNCNSFDGLIPLLPKDRFYVFFDLPGHGKSSAIPLGSFYDLCNSLALVERIRKQFSWIYFSLMGHCLGANISAIYAAVFPERVDKLIIFDLLAVLVANQVSVVDVFRRFIENYMNHESEVNQPRPSHTYEAAKAKLLAANKSLKSHSADVLLERGAVQQKDGTYVFLRDVRHKFFYRSLTLDVGTSVLYMSRVQAETFHIIAEDGFYQEFSRIPTYAKRFDQIWREGFKSCELHRRIDVPGKHHVHLCNPHYVIDHVTSLLNRPVRSRLAKKSSVSSKL